MQRSKIKVSVIVPVYNTEAYLKECLDSLVHQTLPEIEIILINDGSTDSSEEIMKGYLKKYPDKIRMFTRVNGGQAAARNQGLSLCSGEYVGFVDSDDSVDSAMYEQMYKRAVLTSADMVECGYGYYEIKNGRKYRLKNYASVSEKKNKRELFLNPLVSPWNKLYKASVLKRAGVFFPEGLIYEDTAFYINLIPYINRAVYLEAEYVTHYYRKNSTQTQKHNPRAGEMITVIHEIIQFYHVHHFWDTYFAELEYFCVKILLCSSLGRIALLRDKKLKMDYHNQIINIIDTYFSNYRSNKYLKRGIRGCILKLVNKYTIRGFGVIFGQFYRIRMKV
ncbi:glycosyltransferase family 2 protein [Robinsoniella peoriensis]|uniref:glycosyltransferase family 2 protein n=1 Tax=Robinsoniella peoriensis TaxID=180332 RepID=UPI0005C7D832|nr:glycosyltransferase family 2 protein [Robinsoniella peoriensis]